MRSACGGVEMILVSKIEAERIEFDDTLALVELALVELALVELAHVIRRKTAVGIAKMRGRCLYPNSIVTSFDDHERVCMSLEAALVVSESMIGHIDNAGVRIMSPVVHTVAIEVDERLKNGVLYILFGKLEPLRLNIEWPGDDIVPCEGVE